MTMRDTRATLQGYLVVLAVMCAPIDLLATTIDGTEGDDEICLFSDSFGARRVCVNGDVADDPVTLPITVNALGGNDTVVVRYSSMCTCSCGTSNELDFATYSSTITINGGSGIDRLVGGNGTVLINGGPGTDDIIGGFMNDTLDGDAGNDDIVDVGGTDALYGGDDADCLQDVGCSFTVCDCEAPGFFEDETCACAGCTDPVFSCGSTCP